MRATTANNPKIPGEEQPYSSFFIILTPENYLNELLFIVHLMFTGKIPKNPIDCQL